MIIDMGFLRDGFDEMFEPLNNGVAEHVNTGRTVVINDDDVQYRIVRADGVERLRHRDGPRNDIKFERTHLHKWFSLTNGTDPAV